MRRLAFLSLVLVVACADDSSDDGADGDGTAADSGDDDDDDDDTTAGDTGGSTDGGGGSTAGATSTTGGVADVCPYDVVEGNPAMGWELIANGFDRPVIALGDPADPQRLFVGEQGGDVRILESGETEAPADAFLSLTVAGAGAPTIGGERGLLGFAFHPDWPEDQRVYVSYNRTNGDSVIAEYEVDAADESQVDPGSERIIMELGQPAGNHNGGMIAFGPDGYLYIGWGDGGGGGDTYNTSRNFGVVFAKILRIGVEPDGSDDNPRGCVQAACSPQGPFDYTIPEDNPFVGDEDYAPEIWAVGLRNPWRFAFDQETDQLWVGDVGQNANEEITIVEAGSDHGWALMEGLDCFDDPGCDDSADPGTVNRDGLTMPIYDYAPPGGQSVIGGAVYRGCEVPAWSGTYTFGDFFTENLSALTWDGSTADVSSLPDFNGPILGHGWNSLGDVYVTMVTGNPYQVFGDGRVYRLAPAR